MSLSSIVISAGAAIPDRISRFLDQASFFEIQAIVRTADEALALHNEQRTMFFFVEMVQATTVLAAVRLLPEAERPRLMIFGPEENYFLEQGAIEPVLFQTDQFFSGGNDFSEQLSTGYLKSQVRPGTHAASRDLLGTTALQSKPVWLLMEPGQWLLDPQPGFSELLYVRTEGGIKRLRRTDLLLVEAQKDYLKLVARDTTYRVLRSLKSIESRLDPRIHCRVHRSFIVSLEAIHSIDQEALWIDGIEEAIPIGPNYRKELLARLEII